MSKFIRFGSVEEGLNKMLFLPLHVCTPLGLGTYVPPYFYAVGVSRPSRRVCGQRDMIYILKAMIFCAINFDCGGGGQLLVKVVKNKRCIWGGIFTTSGCLIICQNNCDAFC